MQALRDVVAAYVIDRNSTVDSILDLLEEQRLDRALELLLDGKVDQFIALDEKSSSFSSQARVSIQAVGQSTRPSETLRGNVGGVDPRTGLPSPSQNFSTSRSSDAEAPEDVEVRVALSKALSEISGDEAIRSIAFTTFEEQRNRALYELCGEVESGFISDEDPTLPWIAKTGSLRDRIFARYQKALDAVEYILANPDKFEDV
jgi:hypothetical protein